MGQILMPLAIRDGTNTLREIVALQVRDETNTPREIVEVRVRNSNNVSVIVWSIAPPLEASASPSTVSGSTLGTGTATTNPATCTPSGGTPPYSYLWEVVSYDGPASPVANSAAATTTFTQTGIGVGESYSAVFRCLVTDSTPGTPYSAYSNEIYAFWSDTT